MEGAEIWYRGLAVSRDFTPPAPRSYRKNRLG